MAGKYTDKYGGEFLEVVSAKTVLDAKLRFKRNHHPDEEVEILNVESRDVG